MDDFGSVASGVGAIVDNLISMFNTGYNMYTNKRDFDYQKALQQQIFEREDTAVQRRMADLEAAGLNPNLAAGSAAGAGSVVARSNTNDLNPGSILDTVAALSQLKNQKYEREILQSEAKMKDRENILNEMQALHSLGYDVQPLITSGKDGDRLTYTIDWNKNLGPNKIFQNIDYQNQYNQNSAALIQKQNDWFVTNQLSDIVFDAIGAGTSILKPSFMKKK